MKPLQPENPLLKNHKKRIPGFDIPFLLGVLALLIVGLLMLYSASFADAFLKKGDSYFYIRRQALFALIGLAAMVGVSFVPYNWYRRLSFLFYGFSVLLLILVLVIPTNDAEHRWLYIGGFQFQPSELAKVAVIITLSDYISRNRGSMHKFKEGLVYPACIFVLVTALISVETHLSGAILVAAIGLVLIIAGGCKFWHVLSVGAVGVLGFLGLVLTNDYMQKRILTWLDPSADALGDGWQISQSLITIGSGGLFGLGYGKSRQKYLYMSEPQNDFIFSIVCEELGYIGALFVMALFFFLVWRGIHIAMHAPDTFSSLVVIGIMTRIAVQVILNLAVVTNAVPVTGITLPFFSNGGTALVVLLGEMGIVLHISRYSAAERGT